MNEKRYRLKFTFWLDVTKTAELWLADEIDALKQQRLFSQTTRRNPAHGRIASGPN